jgi:hypothetical protein
LKPRALALALALFAPAARAQTAPRPVTLSLREACAPVALAPGGEAVIRGSARSSHDGTVFDALTARPGGDGVAGEGSPVPGGLFDVDAGGWRVVGRDLRAHAYRLAATGQPGSACVEAGVPSPCLPLRLLPLAQTRLLAVSDFARTMSGELTLEVIDPAELPLRAPPFLARHGVSLAAAAVALTLGALALARWRRHAASPAGQLRRTAARVKRRLAHADPVHRALAPSIDGLLAHATELTALRDRLAARVAASDRPALGQRRAALAAKESEGVAEAAAALRLVDEQIARVDRWSREAERAAARVAEVHEYLRALEQRLDEALGATAAARDESTREALDALERDLQAALEGAREAERVLSGP